ncbi:MAG: cytochrome c, partial [Giesbergeria sp.]|nr:cytochrome c [Giesbergeria sp.]
PAATEAMPPVVLPPIGELNPDAVARGAVLYSRYCAQCHGGGGISSGVLPDLRSSPYLQKSGLFRLPPLEGALAQRGMPSFKDHLNADDIEAIRSYLIDMARVTLPGATVLPR